VYVYKQSSRVPLCRIVTITYSDLENLEMNDYHKQELATLQYKLGLFTKYNNLLEAERDNYKECMEYYDALNTKLMKYLTHEQLADFRVHMRARTAERKRVAPGAAR